MQTINQAISGKRGNMFRKLSVAAGAAMVLATLGMTAASATTASSSPVFVPSMQYLNFAACPADGTCVAVGANQTNGAQSVIVHTATGKVTVASHVLKNTLALQLACPSESTCLTTGTGSSTGGTFDTNIISVSASTGAMKVTATLKPPKQHTAASVLGLACAGSKTCWVAGVNGLPQDTSNTPLLDELSASGKILKKLKVAGWNTAGPVACESKSTCLVDVYNTKNNKTAIVPLVNGKLGEARYLPSAQNYVGEISCYGSKLCYASGFPETNSTVSEFWPLNTRTGAPGKAIRVSSYTVAALSCYDTTQCISAGASGSQDAAATVTISGGKAGAVTDWSSVLNQGITSLACTASKVCYAVGQEQFSDSSGSTSEEGFVLDLAGRT
jgi:hypothetical protein